MRSMLMSKIAAGIIAVTFVFSSTVNALDLGGASVDVSAGAGVLSKYVWRGVILTDDPVVQPWVTVGAKGLSLNLWSNVDLGDVNGHSGDFTELDYTLDYTVAVKSLKLSAGAVHYTFPNTEYDPTTEIYLGVGTSLPCSPSLKIYQDVDLVEGTYVSLSGARSIPLGCTSIDISGALGFGSGKHNEFYYYTPDAGGIADFLLSASVPFTIAEKYTVAPNLTFTSLLNGDARDSFDAADIDTENIVFGVNLSASF